MKNMPIVMKIARSIRRSAEKHEEYDPDLTGWCALTSNILFAELARRGIQSRLIWNGSHCFLTYGHYLIDITATQFDFKLPRVVKRLRSDKTKAISWWREDYWVSTMKDCKTNRDWATGPSRFQKEWQDKMRAHLKSIK